MLSYRLRHLSIGRRIALALAIPIVAFVGFSLWSSIARYHEVLDNRRAHEMTEFATIINTLVHTLQAERGTAVAHLGSGGAQFTDALPRRYQSTDQASAAFSAAANLLRSEHAQGAMAQQIAALVDMIGALEPLRQQVQQHSVSAQAPLARYGALVDQLIGLIRKMMLVQDVEGEVSHTLSAYIRLMQAKEYAGLERAVGAAGFSARRFDASDITRMVELAERQRLYIEEYRLYASAQDMRLLDEGWTMQDAAKLSAMRQFALTDPGQTAMDAGIAVQWFELTSRRIDQMHDMEQQLARSVMQQAKRSERAAMWSALWVSLLAMGTLLATLLVARQLTQDIIKPLQRVTLGMRRLAQGDQAVESEPGPDQRADEIGDMMRAMAVFRSNLAEIVKAQAQIGSQAMVRRKERYQRALLDSFPFEVWLKDVEGRYLAVNRTLSDNMGLSGPDAAIGQCDEDLREPMLAATLRRSEQEVLLSGLPNLVEEGAPPSADEPARWLEIYHAPVLDDQGAVLGSVGFSRDISDRKQAQEEVRQLALYDALTKLPNRRLLQERLALAILQARRDRLLLAIAFVDLDGFKPVNDRFGHAAGDLLLQAVASRMQACVREVDTVARIGGDEFIVLLSQIEHAGDALAVAEKIRHSLNQPFELDGYPSVSISSSTGVAVFPDHGEDPQSLTHAADLAMYQAKERGRNRVVLYAP